MSTEFTLTPQPVRATGISRQPLDQAVEVTGYDVITALLGVLSVEGGSPSVTIEVITGMQKDTDDGWLPLVSFANVTGSNVWERKVSSNEMLKYIRWNVTVFAGTAATFTLGGLLRTNA